MLPAWAMVLVFTKLTNVDEMTTVVVPAAARGERSRLKRSSLAPAVGIQVWVTAVDLVVVLIEVEDKVVVLAFKVVVLSAFCTVVVVELVTVTPLGEVVFTTVTVEP